MSVKKFICIIISLVMLSVLMFTLTVSAAADPSVSPYWHGTMSEVFVFSVNDQNTGYITTSINGDLSVTKIEATTQLFIFINNGLVKYGSSNYHVVDKNYLSVVDTYTNLPAGRYSATLSATVYSPNGNDYITDTNSGVAKDNGAN